MDDGVPLVTAAAPRAYCLLEVPPELEAHLVPHADAPPLVLNGRAGDDAALTTPHRTYAAKPACRERAGAGGTRTRDARTGTAQRRRPVQEHRRKLTAATASSHRQETNHVQEG